MFKRKPAFVGSCQYLLNTENKSMSLFHHFLSKQKIMNIKHRILKIKYDYSFPSKFEIRHSLFDIH